jgi:SAM-dependent methyltransferase
MSGYYDKKLAASSLEHCYQLAPPRVQQYLRAEVDFVAGRLRPTDVVLDLGCGYGRTLPDLARAAAFVVGIDTSEPSLALARERLGAFSNVLLAKMDASRLAFVDGSFDAVICIQNGISAFHVDQRELVREALRVLKPDGTAMFSSYSDRFWEHRLAWFEAQASAGLIGEIDRRRTGNGVITCTDGLTLTAVEQAEFTGLIAGLDAEVESTEVDESSWFYVLRRPPS